jgi:hypothetical protein
MKKNECNDIFRDIRQNKSVIFEQKDYKRFLDNKINYKSRKILFNRLNLYLKLGILSESVYIMVLLRRIELSKELFIIELEQGKEVFISKDLSQDNLPKSFRYYDYILQMVQENISQDRKQFYALQKAIQFAYKEKNESILQKLLKSEEKERLVFSHTVLN